MALVDLVYRCPECGHDPVDGEGDWVACPACQVRVERTRQGLVVRPANGEDPSWTTAQRVCEAIERCGGPLDRATRASGSINYDADAVISWRASEDAVWFGGMLVGFAETMGPGGRGTVSVSKDSITITGGSAEGGGVWNHLDILAMQSTSSSLQLSLPVDRLVQFTFLDDSPRRWEVLMQRLISDAHQRAGRGRVIEFQPRIVTDRC